MTKRNVKSFRASYIVDIMDVGMDIWNHEYEIRDILCVPRISGSMGPINSSYCEGLARFFHKIDCSK